MGEQERVFQGDDSQRAVEHFLLDTYGDQYELVSVAARHTKAPDLIAKIGNKQAQFEIKGRNTAVAPIKFYEKMIGRGQPDPVLDRVAKIYTDGRATTFSDLIDVLQQENPTVGFPGDPKVAPSGSVWLNIVDRPHLSKIRTYLINEMRKNGDNYFAIHNRQDDAVSVFYTGHGPNDLNAPRIPNFVQMAVDTYGGSYKNKMRAGIKVKLAR